MIMVYKVLNGYDLSLEYLFAVDKNLIISSWKNNTSKKQYVSIFSITVVNNWKSLPFDAANAHSIKGFKNKLDKC